MTAADKNRETWRQVQEEIETFPDREEWNRWRSLVTPLVERAIESEFDSLFRAGMSLSHLVFSTLDHHGLRNEPRITVDLTTDFNLRISYSTSDLWFQQPTQFEIVEPRLAFPVFTRYLQHLWEETLPEPIPEALRKRSNYEPNELGTQA